MKNNLSSTLRATFRISTLAIFLLLWSIFSNAQSMQGLIKAKVENQLKDDHTGFVENKGQLKDQSGKSNTIVKYLLNMPGLNVQLRATGFSYNTWVSEKVPANKKNPEMDLPEMIEKKITTVEERDIKFHRVDIELSGANPLADIITELPVPTEVNVLDGKITYTNIRSYKKIIYKDIYPGIDLEFLAKKGTDKPIEYNFIVHPGADPSLIKMQYNGANKIALKNGQISMDLAFGTLKEKIPVSFIQQTGQNLAVQYKADENAIGSYAFNVPDYDKTKTLVIDPTPTMIWATYLGGTELTTAYDQDQASAVRVDKLGNIVVTGCTSANTGIATGGAYQGVYSPPFNNGYVAKYTAAGVKTWATYIGGNGDNYTSDAVLDNNNNIYVSMWTNSTNLQTSAGVHQTASGGSTEGYIIKFTPVGVYAWGTYFGGIDQEVIYTINILPSDGNIIIGAITGAGGVKVGFGTGFDKIFGGGTWDGVVAKFNATTGAGIWGTLYGGTGDDYVLGVTGDVAGNIYFSGESSSANGIATAGSFQSVYGGSTNAYLGKLSSTAATLAWATYYGGAGGDPGGFGLLLDQNDNPIIFGGCASPGLATPGAYQTTMSGAREGLIAKFSPAGSRIWATYFGGNGIDMIQNAGFDENGNIFICGYTSSTTGIATNCSFQPTFGGGTYDCYVAKLDSAGKNRIWGSYFGGNTEELNNGRANDSDPFAYAGNGVFYIVGTTSSAGLSTGGAADGSMTGVKDGFVAKLSEGFAPADVLVTNQTVTPSSQAACALGIPNVITGNLVSIYNPPSFISPVFYQWQVADAIGGPWADLPGEVFKDMTPPASNITKYYRRNVLVNDGYCDKKVVSTSPISTVTITANNAPIANANGPEWFLCGSPNTVTLNGSATGGSGVYSTYQWYAGSNLTTPVASTQNYIPTNITSATTYTLKVTDNVGCVDLDQVTISPVVANAGSDSVMCQGSGGVQIGTTGVAGGDVLYSWTILSGTAGSLSCTACAQPIATPAVATTYRLTVTVTRKNATTCVTTDDVVLSFVAAPTNGPAIAGTDKTICKTATVILGNGTADPAAVYTWVPSNYLSNPNIAKPVFNAGIAMLSCPLTYTVTATKGGCSFTDQLQVSVINPAVDYENQTIPCYALSEQLNEPNCGNATYAWVVTAPGQQPVGNNLRDNGASAVVYNPGATNAVFYRNTTLNGVTCPSGNIIVQPCGSGCPPIQIKVVGKQGCPKKFPGRDLQLYLKNINPADWNYSWTPANIMDNPNAPVVSITSSTPASVNVVITNKITGLVCTTIPFPINNPAWVLPAINIPDKSICANTPTAIGEPLIGGYSYEWTPTAGLDNPGLSNPFATLASTVTFNVIKTEDATGCAAEQDVEIQVGEIAYDAGTDRTICNGGTVTLGTNPPVGSTYTYSWNPAGAAYINGTTNTSANPQVLFAGSSQTFTVTVTDPVTGCTKIDNVTLNGGVSPGEYAGPAIGPICPGSTAQLGRAAEPTATYLWSPATGLSCTTCSNPIVTAGTANQTYTVNVSYPGCVTPVADQVTVSVKAVPVVVFTDKTVCPSVPVNIGVGGTGNSASIAGVALYSWSPATSLSCTSCASPNANPQAITTYTATITLTNGCVITEDATITPTFSATAKPDATICPGSSVQLGSPSQAGVTYGWTSVSGSPVGTLSCTNCAQPVATPTVTTVYRLTASFAGCTVIDDVQIIVKALPPFTIAGNSSICTGGTANLTASPITANTSYQWSPITNVASPNSATTQITPTVTTTYRLTQTDMSTGCSDFKEVIVAVLPNNINASGGTLTICPATSAIMPLTITPSFSQTVVWSPATNLSNQYSQNPIITPQASGIYIATVTNTITNCTDTALVTIIVPASCLGSDFGDAPASYDAGGAASHSIVSTLKIGSSIDAEGVQTSTALANGDDINQVANDEAGISFLPTVNTTSNSTGIYVNSVLNNTGSIAYLVAWVDFNRDGDFDDAGERSAIVPVTSSAISNGQILQFSGFNNGCVVSPGLSYLRVRLTTDISGSWDNNPLSKGSRINGEVEDYAIIINGTDFGDAPVIYPVAAAVVNADLTGDGKPDAAGSVWLGNTVDYPGCTGISSVAANADDNDGLDDEDGMQPNGSMTIGIPKTWNITLNSNGPVTGVQWGIWIDWDADGVFDEFRSGSEDITSTTMIPVIVTAPGNAVVNYVVRVGIKTGDPFTAPDFAFPVVNGEWEDYISLSLSVLPLKLISFNAAHTDCKANLDWATASEQNTDRFEIEQSTDGINWSVALIVPASGNTLSGSSYNASIMLKDGALNYLRLKMADRDGHFTYSPVRLLRCKGSSIIIVPNPVKDKLMFSGLRKNSVILITDNIGQLVLRANATTSNYSMNVSGLISGIYFVEVAEDGKKVATQKIVKE